MVRGVPAARECDATGVQYNWYAGYQIIKIQTKNRFPIFAAKTLANLPVRQR
jgi:hypothetical protein